MSTNASWSDLVNLKNTKFKSGLPNFESSDLYFQVWHLGIFFFSAEATALLWEPLLLFEELAGASSPTPEFNNFLIEKSDQETIRTLSIVSSDQFFSATGVSSPYIRHQLAGLRILYPVETSQDRLALLFHQSVDHRLYRPHWGVVRLWEIMSNS